MRVEDDAEHQQPHKKKRALKPISEEEKARRKAAKNAEKASKPGTGFAGLDCLRIIYKD